MSLSISDRIRQAVQVLNGTIDMRSHVPVVGEWDVKVIRADGTIEAKTLRNTVTVTGLNRIAACAVNSAGGVFNSTVIGSATAAPALTDSQSSMGEVGRKSWITTGANAQSREWIFGVATWGGAADGITSVALGSAGISIGASSLATSMLANRVNGLGVTLGNSDFLNLTVRVRIGSHDVAHST
jgi:hypothetical protein